MTNFAPMMKEVSSEDRKVTVLRYLFRFTHAADPVVGRHDITEFRGPLATDDFSDSRVKCREGIGNSCEFCVWHFRVPGPKCRIVRLAFLSRGHSGSRYSCC
jgi:hypothetical protein